MSSRKCAALSGISKRSPSQTYTMKISLNDIQAASQIVYKEMPPTPQYRWPLLSERLGTDDEVANAMCMMFECTHNVCEGAGAAALAAAIQEKPRLKGKKVAVVASGGNVDQAVSGLLYSIPFGATTRKQKNG